MVAVLYASVPFFAGVGLIALAVSLLSRVSSGPGRWPVTRRAFIVGCSALALAGLAFIVATVAAPAIPIGSAQADGPIAASRLFCPTATSVTSLRSCVED